MKTKPIITEGNYYVTIRGHRERVQVRDTYLYESPRKETALKAHWLDGFPRFPWRVSELVECGAVFERIAP